MPIKINGETYYNTLEACEKTGISRATMFRWLKRGILQNNFKNQSGWRIFTEEDINEIRAQTNIIQVEHTYLPGKRVKTRTLLRRNPVDKRNPKRFNRQKQISNKC
jgi:DNA-binding transcriptional MerR regulator